MSATTKLIWAATGRKRLVPEAELFPTGGKVL